MAPEQAEGRLKAIGPPIDVYRLGSIVYELLAARTPFRGESRLEYLKQISANDPIPPRSDGAWRDWKCDSKAATISLKPGLGHKALKHADLQCHRITAPNVSEKHASQVRILDPQYLCRSR